MNKLNIIPAIITVVIVIAGIFFLTKTQPPIPNPEPETYEYFWGDGCPHCANVEEFTKTWKKPEGINIKEMEVWYNKENAGIAEDRGKRCGIAKKDTGVPLLYTPDGQCIQGDTDIINFYKSLK